MQSSVQWEDTMLESGLTLWLTGLRTPLTALHNPHPYRLNLDHSPVLFAPVQRVAGVVVNTF